MEDNQTFVAIRERQAERNFSHREIPPELLRELLELSNRAPSGFNLQPWHFVVVQDPTVKELLTHVAMSQRQVREAPATVIFVADPHAWRTSYRQVLESGVMHPRQVESYRRNVNLLFRTGPFGLFGLAKRIAVPIRRLRRPTPEVITSSEEAVHYVRCQTMLAAATFMIAAQAAGLTTSPMEGFDEYRLKKLLGIPSFMSVPIIVPVGYALEVGESTASYRIPLSEKLSFNRFGSR